MSHRPYDQPFSHHDPSMYIGATADSNGNAQGFLGPVPAGYCWYVERECSWTNTTAETGLLLEVFVIRTNAVKLTSATVGDRTGRQDVSTIVINDISDNNSDIVVPEGHYLVAFWTGLSSGDLVLLSTQIAVHLNSLRIESPQLQHQQEHPTPDINGAEVAKEDDLISKAEHATADVLRDVRKAL
jgi:hypothetical protein